MLTGNKGEWSEPYALLKLIADGKLYLGTDNFQQVKDIVFPIMKIIRHEKEREVDFTYEDSIVIVKNGEEQIRIPIAEFIRNSKICFERIASAQKGSGAFPIPEIEEFLASFSIVSLKAKSKLKNDITIQIEDNNTFLSPTLGFSIKSQMGGAATLVNASKVTNFTYLVKGSILEDSQIQQVNEVSRFSEKICLLKEMGCYLEYSDVENEVFKLNLQTVDYHFDIMLARILELYYSNEKGAPNTVEYFTQKLSEENPLKYNLRLNSSMYQMAVTRFLYDYALGMRAGEIWTRDYQATGGYLIVREDGEIICYHFYFLKSFENYLYKSTKLETPSKERHEFGNLYREDGVLKMKLNLQIRFIE